MLSKLDKIYVFLSAWYLVKNVVAISSEQIGRMLSVNMDFSQQAGLTNQFQRLEELNTIAWLLREVSDMTYESLSLH